MTGNQGKPANHARIQPHRSQNGELWLGDAPGMGIRRLTDQIGQTPFYAYQRGHIRARIDHLQALLPAGVELHYALKANPMPALVDFMATQVEGIDVASASELRTALNSGMSPAQISFAGPAKTPGELCSAVAAGVLINCESFNELDRIAQAEVSVGCAARVALRINPDFTLKTSGMKMGGGAQQFGIDAEQCEQALVKIRSLGLHFEGFHIFAGSQNLNAAALIEAHRETIALVLRLASQAPSAPQLFNLGGGFGIPYFPGEHALDCAAVCNALAENITPLKQRYPAARIALELGRYLVGEAGVYICRITDIKISRGRTFYITNGGLHQHLAASGNFGQVIRKNYPVDIATKLDQPCSEHASIVGPLCTPLDLLADNMLLPRAEIGDLVVVYQSGAYGLSASPTRFLGHPGPVEVLI